MIRASPSLVFDSPNRGGPVRPPFGKSPTKIPTKGCAPSPYRASSSCMIYPFKVSRQQKHTENTHTHIWFSGSCFLATSCWDFHDTIFFQQKSRVNYYLQKKWCAEDETNKFQTLCPFNGDFMNLMVNSMLCYKGSKLSNLLATGPPCRFNKKRHHHVFLQPGPADQAKIHKRSVKDFGDQWLFQLISGKTSLVDKSSEEQTARQTCCKHWFVSLQVKIWPEQLHDTSSLYIYQNDHQIPEIKGPKDRTCKPYQTVGGTALIKREGWNLTVPNSQKSAH